MAGLRWTEQELAEAQRRGVHVLSRQQPQLAASGHKLQPPASPITATGGPPAPGGEGVEDSPQPFKRKRGHPEQDLQRAAVELLNAALPSEYRAVHVPNGGWRSKIEAAILKAMGVRAGFPDLPIIGPNGQLALVIEFKAGKNGRLSTEQAEWRDWFIRIGVPWALCRSIDDVLAACQDAGIRLRVAA